MNSKHLLIIFILFVDISLNSAEPDYRYPKTRVPDGGYIATKDVAEKVAQIILSGILGSEEMKSYIPYEARYVDRWKAWEVYGKGVQKIDGKLAVLGGEPHILIRKSDGTILSYWTTK